LDFKYVMNLHKFYTIRKLGLSSFRECPGSKQMTSQVEVRGHFCDPTSAWNDIWELRYTEMSGSVSKVGVYQKVKFTVFIIFLLKRNVSDDKETINPQFNHFHDNFSWRELS